MEQTISFKIDVPEGKKAVLKDNKIAFEDIKPQLPKTWEEFCSKYMNAYYYINGDSSIERLPLGYVYNSNTDKNLLPSIETTKSHLALMQLHQLRDCYRQGWEPNCANYTTIYFIIRFYSIDDKIQKYCVTNNKHNNHFLSFQSKEIAEEFLNNFRDLIEEAGDLI